MSSCALIEKLSRCPTHSEGLAESVCRFHRGRFRSRGVELPARTQALGLPSRSSRLCHRHPIGVAVLVHRSRAENRIPLLLLSKLHLAEKFADARQRHQLFCSVWIFS